jgi:hypothetical protein
MGRDIRDPQGKPEPKPEENEAKTEAKSQNGAGYQGMSPHSRYLDPRDLLRRPDPRRCLIRCAR